MALVTLHRPKGTPRERLLLIGGFAKPLYEALQKTGLLIEEILDGKEALDGAAQRTYGVVLCSLRMQTAWGIDVLDAILKADPHTPVIISTWERSPKVVVEAMQHGAYDYLIEPVAEFGELLDTIERAVRHRAARMKGRRLREELEAGEGRYFEEIVGRSAALGELCGRIRQAAAARTPVLIEGESGSGKELVARALHRASPAARGPFVAIHCGAIPENLLESELFGHEKGAFTGAESTRVGVFEEAHGGTLFLDEIGLTSPACQGKLLRVLETGAIRRVGASREFKVDVRIVSATNEPLDTLVESGRFRADLLYRLNVVTLRVPPLRERPADIEPLAYHFAQRFALASGKPFEAFSAQAVDALHAYAYPGNVRELRNLVERAVVFSRGPVVRRADLPEPLRHLGLGESPDEAPRPGGDAYATAKLFSLDDGNGLSLDERLARAERALIEDALRRTGGNRTRAAKLLKIKRTTLVEKLARLEAPAANGRLPSKKGRKPRRTAKGSPRPARRAGR
ncbi:MAG: sigma-54 dependent transcriptional regulator [Planctomycetes bacterium]|nr:sigma-54 dependent transcriptional regulator [Planctomycetota bacterium]